VAGMAALPAAQSHAATDVVQIAACNPCNRASPVRRLVRRGRHPGRYSSR
jgi:hypothetical protein